MCQTKSIRKFLSGKTSPLIGDRQMENNGAPPEYFAKAVAAPAAQPASDGLRKGSPVADADELNAELLCALRAARWYVARSKHLTEMGRMKRDKDLAMIDAAIWVAT